MPPLGTAPRLIGGVWYTRTGRRLTAAGQRYWTQKKAQGFTDGQGHILRPRPVVAPNTQTAKPTGPVSRQPGFMATVAADLGHNTAQVRRQQATYDRSQRAKSEAAAQVDRLVSAQFGGVEQIAARANKVVSPPVNAALEALSPRTAVDQTVSALKHGTVGKAVVAGAGIIPFGPGKIREAVQGVEAGVDAGRAVKATEALGKGRRSLTVGEKTQQLPRARSRITQTFIEKNADVVSGRFPKAPVVGSEARVARAAGRETASEADRAASKLAAHGRALPKQGSAEDVAHFWWAQLPAKARTVDSLKTIRDAQAGELQRIHDGSALEELQKRGAKLKIADLPHKAHDLSVSVAQLDEAIKAAPKLNPKVIQAVHAFSADRQQILQDAGLLTADRADARRRIVSRWLGHEPTGEEAFIGHRLDTVRGATEPLVPKSPGVGKARIPEGVSRENKLVRAKTGRVRMSTHVAAEDWRAAQNYRQAVRARTDLAQMGKPFTGVLGKDELLVNPKGRPVPKEWKTDKLAQLDPHNEKQIRDAADQITQGFLADKQNAGDLLAQAAEHGVHWHELRVVPKRIVERYYGQFAPARAATVGGRVYDKAVDATAASIIFGRVGYIPKNIAQNLIMAAPHQGPYLLANAPRAAQLIPRAGQAELDRHLWDLLAGEVGSGATGALGKEFTSKLGGIPSKVTGAVSGIADTPLRISAFLHEASAEHVIPRLSPHLSEKDKKALLELLTDPSKRPQLNDIRSRSVEAMADFSRMTPKQRKWARRFLIIPGWLAAGTRYPIHFAATHPLRSGALAYVAAGEPGAPKGLQVNKPINEYFRKGIPPYVQGIDTGGGKVLRTNSLSPVSTPWDILNAVRGKQGNTVADYANPLAAAGWHIANQELTGPYGSYPTTQKKAVVGNLKRLAPSASFIGDLIHPPKNPRTYPEDTSRLGRLKREVGIVPIQVQGSIRGVEKQQADTAALIKKLGIGNNLPPVVKKSYARMAERDQAWKDATHGKKAGSRDYYVAKYKADLALAQKWGYLKPDQVAKAQEWIQHAPVDDIRKAHHALSDQGGIYDKELSPARETQKWLQAQDAYATDLNNAVKHGELTETQAKRAKAWARKASHGDIDKARVALERRMMAPIG